MTIRKWYLTHKWSSIVSTLFLLMLCVTGLPLIFHDEIETLTDGDAYSAMAGAPSAEDGVPLDTLIAKALATSGDTAPLFIGFSQDSPVITVTTGPSPDAPGNEMSLWSFNRATGEEAGQVEETGVMHFLLQLHTDMFLGQWGMWFLGLMGLLFVVAIVSGVVVYVPFMRRVPFGTIRAQRTARVKWLDYHNMLGIVTLAWAVVVGLTGVINAFADPLVANWRNSELADMTAAYSDAPAIDPRDYASVDAAMAVAKAAQPGLSPQFIGFPGGAWSSGHHYAIFFQGASPLTSHVLTPALVDARTGRLTDMRSMPWYNQALMLSKPLHFGDYGALPLKIIWALLDLFTIWVLGTGLYLWLAKRDRSGQAPSLSSTPARSIADSPA